MCVCVFDLYTLRTVSFPLGSFPFRHPVCHVFYQFVRLSFRLIVLSVGLIASVCVVLVVLFRVYYI